MTPRTVLLAATSVTSGLVTLLASLAAVPALAAVDPPPASNADKHMRSVPYDANNPIELPTVPGASLRIILAPDETVERVIPSDEGIMNPGADEDTATPQPSTVVGAINGVATSVSNVGASTGQGGQDGSGKPVCDPNLCRDVTGNIIYLKPLRSLDPQPLFIHTTRLDPVTGRTERVPYAFLLVARGEDGKAASADTTLWSVTVTYPAREHAERLAVFRKAAAARLAAERERLAERQAMLPPLSPGPSASDNHRYGYKGSAAVMPDPRDGVWDDGRTTFMRFSGNRHIPNVYERGPDGKPALAHWATEPDATGTTLRIAGTEAVWTLRDGDEAGCVINGGHDPDGRTAPTVSGISENAAPSAEPSGVPASHLASAAR